LNVQNMGRNEDIRSFCLPIIKGLRKYCTHCKQRVSTE
jgi:hypothetical protein